LYITRVPGQTARSEQILIILYL